MLDEFFSDFVKDADKILIQTWYPDSSKEYTLDTFFYSVFNVRGIPGPISDAGIQCFVQYSWPAPSTLLP